MQRMDIDSLQAENKQLRADLQQQKSRVQQLEEMIMALRHRHFSSKSEMTSPDQTSLFDEADSESEE